LPENSAHRVRNERKLFLFLAGLVLSNSQICQRIPHIESGVERKLILFLTGLVLRNRQVSQRIPHIELGLKESCFLSSQDLYQGIARFAGGFHT
jgi:hypothetical protein